MKTNPLIMFLRLSRPLFLFGGALQFALGAGIARYLGVEIDWEIYILGQLWVTTGQLGTHYLNEYFDAEADAVNPNRTIFSGGSGVLGEGEGKLPRSTGILAAAAMFTAVALLTLGMMRAGKFDSITAIVAGLIFVGAFFYSMPPLRLSHTGYGELTTAVLLANLVPAFAYILQTGELHRLITMSTFPLTALMLAMMVAIEFPDYGIDLKYQKKTLLTRVGWENGMAMHHIFVLSAYIFLGLALMNGLPKSIAVPAFLSLPLGLWQIWYMRRIADGIKPNWTALTTSAVMLFALTSYLLAFSFWTR